jgi:hypothetical protein
LDDEAGVGTVLWQAVQLGVRGLRIPIQFALAAALFVVLVGGSILFGKQTYAPHYVLRVVETDRDPSSLPRPRRELAEYVQQAVFTSKPLFELIRRYQLYPSLSVKNPRAALDAFREDVEVRVYRNYFVEERSAGGAPRSVRLSVGYHAQDPNIATQVTRDLGALIVAHEVAMRRDQSAAAASYARHEVAGWSQVYLSRTREIQLKRAEIERVGQGDAQRQVELISLLGSQAHLLQQRDQSQKRQATLALDAALEGRGLGMSFDVVDDASLSTGPEQRKIKLMLGGASLLIGLPLVAMAVGAFNPSSGRV